MVLILILFVLAVAANVGVLYMSPNLNFYALVGINVIFILLFIALYPLFVSFKDIKKGRKTNKFWFYCVGAAVMNYGFANCFTKQL